MPASPDRQKLARARAGALLHKLDLEIRHTLKSQDAHRVHDLRVATRRFAQALKIFKPLLESANVKSVRARCDAVMKYAGKVRDLDIAMKILRDEHGTDAADVLAGVQQKREQRAKQLHRLIARTNGHLAVPSSNGATDDCQVHDAIVKAGHRLFKRAEKLSDSRDPHPVRIAAKQLRYTLELAGASEAAIRQLADLQSELGHVHDMQTVRDTLSRHRGAKKLLPKLEGKQKRLTREAMRIWKRDFGGKKNREMWMGRVERASKSMWRS